MYIRHIHREHVSYCNKQQIKDISALFVTIAETAIKIARRMHVDLNVIIVVAGVI